jgi:prepilin peptidase CpaA
VDLFLIVLLVASIGVAMAWDVRCRKIPNLVTYPTMCLALGYHSFSSGTDGLLFSVGGLALGIGLFIVPYVFGGMGAGDTKLMGAVGAIFGPKGICMASIMVILAGGVYAMILLAMNPKYTASVLRRLGTTFKTFALTAQFILIPPGRDERQPVLWYAFPIGVGSLAYAIMKVTGYDLFAQLL